MATKVVHFKRESYDIYIGRPSKWGNPFKIGVDGTREEVIRKYTEYVIHSSLLQDILELKDKTLGCWCKPQACHGDILAWLADRARLGTNGELLLTLPVDTSEWKGVYGTTE